LGIEVAVGEHVISIEHAYTHFRITLHAYHARHTGGEPQCLGIDAWRITPYLGQLGGGMFGSYHGVTGTLHIDSGLQVHRGLQWARFSGGQAQPLVEPPGPATPVQESLPPAP
jgi:hypothetical protein